ncbi:ATP-dependent RNA helicase DDX28 [Biomphalaria pfeifferi]|uniref:RNA helicase n=1 Tax=Biomphalaria pfeifferi TaxID=112525 RepID=A0AAD8BBV2_BIOPF|nr:ATP-dependent RNA helicase DDX28 [Biomphalaria pfeifferi]
MENLTRSMLLRSSSMRWFVNSCIYVHSEAFQDLPRITCPLKIQKKIQYARDKKLKESFLLNQQKKRRGPLIISCKRRQYNFYQGEVFNEFDTHKLVSCGWKTNKRLGDYFTILPYSNNPSISESSCSFQELGINEKLCEGLRQLGITSPTEIQQYAIPRLLRGSNAICTAETGSGKTLAYLLPAIEWIIRQKLYFKSNEGDESGYNNMNNPNTVIITPSRELTEQVMSVAESLKPYADFDPFLLGNSRKHNQTPMDMLISTPGSLMKQLKSKQISCLNLQHMIIDESDTLFDDSFISDIQKILQMFHVQVVENEDNNGLLGGTQIVLVSATMPDGVETILGDLMPLDAVAKISTQGLHRLQPHVKQKFVRINTQSKGQKLVEIVKSNIDKNEPTLIFVNNNKTCYYLDKMLNDNGISCLKLNGEMSSKERIGVFRKFKDGFLNVLVATDIASRGLDTVNVQHVINYDFPTFISDYIHRVGRVGRVGSTEGQVTSFVTHKWDVELVWKIEIAARKMRKLQDVNANIKMKLSELDTAKNDVFELNII